jgi:histidinol-phosphate aminotransferase
MAASNERRTQLKPAPGVEAVEPYAPPPFPRPIDLKLDGNEGLLPNPRLLDALSATGPDVLRRYPNARPLEEILARQWNVEPDQVLVTAGADEALDRVCRAFLSASRQIILPTPTFEMLPRYARLAGAEIVSVPWSTAAYPRGPVIEQINENTAAIAVVSPNNPTGSAATAADLRAVAAAAPHAVIIVDLAYADFADEDLTEPALALPNAVVVRSLSKSWGLAGLRVGFAAGSTQIVRWLRPAGGPYSVAGPSLALAAEWLRQGGEAMRAYVDRIRVERGDLARALRATGASVTDSQANFVFARFPDAERIWSALSARGIAVRRFPSAPELSNALRITCPGNEHDFARLTQAIAESAVSENRLS